MRMPVTDLLVRQELKREIEKKEKQRQQER